MRIPLDYYRILSVPIKATEQQLVQAYEDRLLQQPRREYNEQAIEARQQLIETAYQVLSNPIQRAEYDAQFLENMQSELAETAQEEELVATDLETETMTQNAVAEVPPVNSTIDIPPSQLVGALSIMHELGEYELVLTQGIEYYNSAEFAQLQQEQDPELNQNTQANLILALALAYMELGREQWHRGEYESAAISTQLGIDLLNQENLFPQVKEELAIDLDKLRPYRVLELISQNPPGSAPRARGFYLLQEMLEQRQGIEGKGEDRSGLNFERCLCFVQQLRTYLTSAEQQQLFDRDTPHDSAIASYLAVYALVGRGFSGKQPEFILRAQRKLDYLSAKQDVTWEQAVCALLLGHTEKAIHKVHQSQDTTKLNQILQHAHDRADLLPGMCFYGEQWLHEEVLAQFVDLAETQLTLKEYFADREVQSYLERLTPATVLVSTTNDVNIDENIAELDTAAPTQNSTTGVGILSRWRSLFTDKAASTIAIADNQIIPTQENYQHQGTTTLEREQEHQTKSRRESNSIQHRQAKHRIKVKPRSTVRRSRPSQHHQGKPALQSLSLPLESSKRAVPRSVLYKAQAQTQYKRNGKKKTSSATLFHGWLFILSLVFGVGILGFFATRLFLKPSYQTAKQVQLAIAISDPTVDLAAVEAKPVVSKPELTLEQKSQQVIEKWLKSKSAAFGKQHQIEQLNTILAEPLLTTWRERAQDYQQNNAYREYQHQVKMRSVKLDPSNAQRAIVEAEVKEVAQHYQTGQLDRTQSYDDNLLVRYQLIRQGEQWLIQNAEVLKTL